MNTIPTNHGNLTINEIFDYLNYVSYKTQRESGVPFEQLRKWYKDHEKFETKLNSEQEDKRSVASKVK